MSDIVALVVTYHVSMKDIKQIAKVKAELISMDYPAWTAVGVSELVLTNFLVEISATATINQ